MLLVISSHKKNAETVSDIFHYMGILANATTPSLAPSEISPRYKAVVIVEPETVIDCKGFIERLKKYYSLIPIIALTDKLSLGYEESFAAIYPTGIYSTTLVSGISELICRNGGSPLGAYRLTGITADSNHPMPSYFDEPVRFTKTECMILRYLTVSYPSPATAKEILKHAFRSGKRPEIPGIRTHISVMNKKFLAAFGRPLVRSAEDGGYVIVTPEESERKLNSEIFETLGN